MSAIIPMTCAASLSSRPICRRKPRPMVDLMSSAVTPPCQASVQPSFIPVTMLGSSADRQGDGIEPHMEDTIKLFRSVRQETLDVGVKIALENHDGDMQAHEVKTIIEQSDRKSVV